MNGRFGRRRYPTVRPPRPPSARYKGRRIGGLGDAARFSCYPGKKLGAGGDGGAVVTTDPKLAEWVRTPRNYGLRVKRHHAVKGFNSRLDE